MSTADFIWSACRKKFTKDNLSMRLLLNARGNQTYHRPMKNHTQPTPACLNWIRESIRKSQAYQLASSHYRYKLDAMESPYGLDDDLKERWLNTLRHCDLNRYPSEQQELNARLHQHLHLPDTCSIMTGNGSDELLQVIAMAVMSSDRCLLSITPDFSMYPVIARNCNLEHIAVPLNKDFSLNLPAVLSAIEKHKPAIVWLSRPNNPIGTLWDMEQVEEIIDKSPGMVLVDEAYQAFASKSCIDKLAEFDNLLICRSFSKIGLAGLRFGALLGNAACITEFNKLRLPYNINTLTLASMDFVLDNDSFFHEQITRIIKERERLYQLLTAIEGVTPIPSHANFILCRLTPPVAPIYQGLCASGILVKQFADDPILQAYIRVTVGAPDENDAFVEQLQSLCQL